jgi:hypothetical protein
MRAVLMTLVLAMSGDGPPQDIPLPISVVSVSRDLPAGPLVELTLQLDRPLTAEFEVARLRTAGNNRWRLDDFAHAVSRDGRMVVTGEAGADTLLWLHPLGHTGYLLHGPFRWPVRSDALSIATRWRRTVRASSRALEDAPAVWVTAIDVRAPEPWPQCAATAARHWECVGVPLESSGVLVQAVPGRVAFALARGTRAGSVEEAAVAAAHWARLLIAAPNDPSAPLQPDVLRVTARRAHVPRARPQSSRLDVEADPAVHIERAGPSAYWITGNSAAGDGWIEVSGRGFATTRIPVQDLAGGSPEIPVRIAIDRAWTIAGRVTAAQGTVAKAIVTIFRFDPGTDDKQRARRIAVAEQASDDDGGFRFSDLGPERYELVAMHPTLGRGERRVEADGAFLELRLRPLSRAIGRVIRGGASIGGLPVVFVPNLVEFQTARDLTELRGGETTTDAEGRFEVALPLRGSGEIRIGDDRRGLRRIPLGSVESLPPVVDLGTIGPAMFRASVPEPGGWLVVAICGREERAVVPALLTIGARDQTIRLAWPLP